MHTCKLVCVYIISEQKRPAARSQAYALIAWTLETVGSNSAEGTDVVCRRLLTTTIHLIPYRQRNIIHLLTKRRKINCQNKMMTN
jgi:hypothetical protein